MTTLDPSDVAREVRADGGADTQHALACARTPQALALKDTLAAAHRLVAARGLDDGIAGHISMRVPGAPHHFWVNALGVMFEECTAQTLCLINDKGEILEGGTMINLAGFLIHAAIHRARPDLNCVAHTHPPAGRAFSALDRLPEMTDQNACSFYDDVALYSHYTGVVVDPDQAAEIGQAMGTKRAVILRNHGLITGAATAEQATIDMLDLEDVCATNLRIFATGQPFTTIEPAAGLQARAVLTQPLRYAAQWAALKRTSG
ncbi:MAG: ribulose-5-phosphate 4-epimerase/fuculose-1-phosphate aldolase [Kiritimatiellia bacterium]|jgi:ribulose-5-phosphate 4-epimerase/fuculose-1-phosphate aldolase